ncbi:MAG: hypothetical protein SO040_07025 [Catenibacterium mitsuokai]|nr:hypothetical protein [Catenibacterium mitsuokai]MDY3676664.1 hypothetical protein [Catenibacterium mitsuokai]
MRNWERPMVVVDTFAANEFVSTCGDKGTIYKFKCDAQKWMGTGLSGSTVWLNGADGQPETSDDILLGTYSKCGVEHEAKKTDEFSPGYLKKNYLGIPGGKRLDVIVWRGENGDNIHCTTNLDIDTWETAKS